ncbi:MAG: O-antigen ligase family protein, partial [Verrucomicrobia bacterium]|nr:O-antigen ligase family protein [Verrucomicrobiota bacterium]
MLQSSRRKQRAPRRSRKEEPEESSFEEEEPMLTTDHRSVPSLKLWSALAVVVAGCGLSGSKSPWALGIVALLIALNLAIAPQRVPVSKTILWPLLLFTLLSLGSFLPLLESSWPWWRQSFANDFGIHLGVLNSPQPWVSLESWILISIGLIWLWHCLGRGFNEPERRWLIRMLTLLVAVLAGLSVWFKQANIAVPFWRHSGWKIDYFGPFPNRNHIGALLAMGAVLAFAMVYDAYRRRSPWWPAYSASLVPILWALFSNTSRAGLALFFLGLMAWMAFASFSRRSARRMGIVTAMLLVLIAVVLMFGRHILGRMNATDGLLPGDVDSRFQVWDACVAMITTTPLLGVGLGCFDAVFVFHKDYFDPVARSIHPESSWLWLTAEVGVPAALMLVVALFRYIARTGLWRSSSGKKGRKDQRMRNACAVAALVLPVHSLVDTPAHQPGLVCIAALLAGLSLRPRRAAGDEQPRLSNIRLLFSGVCCLASVAWFAIAFEISSLPGTSCASMLQDKAQDLIYRGDLAGAQIVMNRAMDMTPMQWNGYFDRGALSLARGLPPGTALEDFARMRFLEPNISLICHEEAILWMQYYPSYAPAAWREAMRREPRRADDYYRWALEAMRSHPEIRSAVRSLAIAPKQKLNYLGNCNPEQFMDAYAEFLEIQSSLELLSAYDRLQFFSIWYRVGDRKELLERLEHDDNWRSDGWPVLAQDRASRKDFQGACQLALENLPAPSKTIGMRTDDIVTLMRD